MLHINTVPMENKVEQDIKSMDGSSLIHGLNKFGGPVRDEK
jgi:hypothetical protein